MKVTAFVLGMIVCAASLQAQDPYWLPAMTQVRLNYTDTDGPDSGTISRFGDSISVSKAFFTPLRWGHSNTTPESQTALDWIQSWLTPACWGWQDDGVYQLHGSTGGTTSAWPLGSAGGWSGALPGERKVDYWLRNDNPEIAVIMWGTNDLSAGLTPAAYQSNLQEVVQTCMANGTIPILTTAPPRSGYDNGTAGNQQRAADFHQAALAVAAAESVPLIEYHDECTTRNPHNPPTSTWDGTNAMWNAYTGYQVPTSIARDGVHPSNWSAGGSNFSEYGLDTNGFNLRNYMTLMASYEVYELVLDVPPPPVNDHVEHSVKYLGNGLYGVTFVVDSNDGQQDLYIAQITFEGTEGGQIQQMQADLGGGGIDVNTETIADIVHGLGDPPYDKNRDSYVLNPFAQNIGGLIEEANSYYVNAYTGVGSAYEEAPLIYIVTTGDVYCSGLISRLGVYYDVRWTVAMPLPGDANEDESVNLSDLIILANNWQQSPRNWGQADFNGDLSVNLQDLIIMANFWQQSGAAVPEPASLALLAMGGLYLLRRRRR